jgi:hypothetical protein
MKTFYIGTTIENAKQAQEAAAVLRQAGWKQVYDWTTHGACSPEAARAAAENEANGVIYAQINIFLLPGGRGTHTELGIAITSKLFDAGKKIYIWGETQDQFIQAGRVCSFYYHPSVKRLTGPLPEALGYIINQ